MRGQWIGNFTGTNIGKLLIDVEKFQFGFDVHAFVQEQNNSLPSIRTHFRVPLKPRKHHLILDENQFFPVNSFTGDNLSYEEIQQRFADVNFPSRVELDIEWDDSTLQLHWTTNVNTSGSCILKRDNPEAPSELQPKIITWSGFKKLVGKLEPRVWVFRGQNQPWRLRTSFHRTGRVNLYRFLNEDIPALHRHLSSRTRHFFNLNDAEQNGAFFNLVQHHGYPTPLLDWTYSPYVAAFFAYRGITRQQAVKAGKGKYIRIFAFNHHQWQIDYPSMSRLDVLPINSASRDLVKFVFRRENGREEAIYRRADYWIFEAGRWRCAGQRAMPAARL